MIVLVDLFLKLYHNVTDRQTDGQTDRQSRLYLLPALSELMRGKVILRHLTNINSD